MPPNEKELKDFAKWGQTPPTSNAHGDEEAIRNSMKRLMPHSWTLSGNQLTGMTEAGPLVQSIPTDYILAGEDEKGLPIFRKVVV